MVAADRAGASRVGCLLLLLVLAAIGYYGVEIGGEYVRYWQMKNAMQSEARQAPSISDEVIMRRLRRRATELALPEQALRFRIRRRTRPREIEITTEWQTIIELPFTTRTWTFRPEVSAQL